MNIESLTSFEQEQTLRWFFHWLPMEKRREFANEYPRIYYKLCNTETRFTELPKQDLAEILKVKPKRKLS